MPKKAIFDELKVDSKTFYLLKKRAENLPKGVIPPRKKGPGRPRKTSPRTDHALRREVMSNPELTAGNLKNSHPEVLQNVGFARRQPHLLLEPMLNCSDANVLQDFRMIIF